LDLFLQRVFDGLFNGAIYASLAVAIVITFRTTGILNFAQGELAVFSAYIALLLLNPGARTLRGSGLIADYIPGTPWPVPLAIAGAVAVGAAAGAFVERLVIRPLARASDLSIVNVTIGLLILINAVVVEMWGVRGYLLDSPFPTGADDYLGVGGARLRLETIGVWATLLVVLTLLAIILRHTRLGLAFRASTTNPESAELCGIPLGRTRLAGWIIAGALGALSAALVAHSVVLDPFMMIRLLIFSFAAATIGGLDSPGGAIVGGIIIGLVQSLVPGYVPGIGTEVSLVPAVAAMLLVLLIRPEGLFGTRRVSRV
jgi:branched-chain amino acid transport system permease protein